MIVLHAQTQTAMFVIQQEKYAQFVTSDTNYHQPLQALVFQVVQTLLCQG